MSSTTSARVDHLVYATPDLDASVAELEARLGVRASVGGRHLGRGTRNALIAFGPTSYLEIIGPDPEQPPTAAPRWFSVDAVPGARLVAWAANAANLEQVVATGHSNGVMLGAIGSGSRQRADGVTLDWRFTDPTVTVEGGVIPFFIDWQASPHPAASASAAVSLVDFRAEHPDPERVARMLVALGLDLGISAGPTPRLVATIGTPSGLAELR
ncbi:MAG: VOC family protein [Gemmatimonadaceae bacterium]